MKDYEADYLYEVWRRGGNPDAIDLDEIPRDFDWVWDEPTHGSGRGRDDGMATD